jgi:D-alanyl-D-alanine carboxypeptidase/D-alanyl-D-alanine-endopeptidase (penicillin-binding protein 4)
VPAALIGAGWVWSHHELETSKEVVAAASEPVDVPALDAPVLSLRRAPQPLADDVFDRGVAKALAPVAAAVNDTSCFVVTSGGRTLVDERGSLAVMPASNLKLITASVALDVLGADHTATTQVAGTVNGGVVDGDLFLVGGGDPLLATAAYANSGEYPEHPFTSLDALADQLVKAGVRRVTGSVVADGSRYDDERYPPTWDADIRKAEAGPLSAAMVNDAKVVANPPPPDLSTIVPGDDPDASAAQQLTIALRQRGVQIVGEGKAGVRPATAGVLAEATSVPLSQIVGEMLTTSDDNTAELLLKEIGLARSGQGTREAGIAAELATLQAWNVPTEGLVIVDGSGLSRQNRVPCSTFAAVLAHEGADGAVFDGLPVAAKTGTLGVDPDNRAAFAGTPAAGKLRAKSGTLSGAKALSGYYPLENGQALEISLIVNTSDPAASATEGRALWRALGTALGSVPQGPTAEQLAPAS